MRALKRLGRDGPAAALNLAALRRAARAAIVMPAMFALGDKVLGNATLATFAAFGSFAMLLLVDFAGPMRDRLRAQLALGVTGGVFVCLGTLASRSPWLAGLAMALVGFGVLFAGVVSSVLAGATASLLLAFILPVSLAGPASSIPDRLAGWELASAASLLAIGLLWPAPVREPLREPAGAACRALAARLRSDVAGLLGGPDAPSPAERDRASARAEEAVAALHREFLATPYRPTGLTTTARAVVRLVDELRWLNAIVVQTAPRSTALPADRAACTVRQAAAAVLERSADALAAPRRRPPGPERDALRAALTELRASLVSLERSTTVELPGRHLPAGSDPPAIDGRISTFLSSLDPSFRAQELSFAVSQVAANVAAAAAAEQRSWPARLLGRQPSGLAGTFAAVQERAAAHVERHSVWLHNSVRGGVGLGLAVFVADVTGVQHSFWVVLGTLSVLRSNALSTGQNALRGLVGTVAGFVVGAILLAAIGTNTTVLWFLLPLAVLLAGVAPAAISFVAGQAAFTLTVVILFNIVAPAGWRVGLLRVEDVALGCAVSLVVGLLFWPRGAGAALGQALAEAYSDSSRYLAEAVEFGVSRCGHRPPGAAPPLPPTRGATRAAAASRRLDDTFRGYLAERGAKPVPLPEVTSLVTGVAGIRLAADAVLDLWVGDHGRGDGDRAAAQAELLASSRLVTGWYDALAASFTGHGSPPGPLARDEPADSRLARALSRDLRGSDGRATATAVRMIWTGDHLDAVRRLQASLAGPARVATQRRLARPPGSAPWWHPARTRAPATDEPVTSG